MKRLLLATASCCLILAFLAGCAARDPRWEALYDRLSEDPGALDWRVLEGRRIVIDPGHGGYFRGALGVDSLSEADANLGVALYLWGMLDEAGAEVSLTRSTDRDFLPGGSEELVDDLSARMAVANGTSPEVFVSIHHNSNMARDRESNRIEIYYRGDDPGASLELAEEIHLHLARNLGIEETVIKPGNYYVMRNSMAGASVLGEASYISNPRVEERLKISTRQRLEAESYFLGILSYFGRGVPVIEHLPPAADTLPIPGSVDFRIGRGAGVPLEQASMRVTLGGKEVSSVWDPVNRTLSCPLPADLPNGRYSVRASARSIRGASSNSPTVPVTVDRRAAHFIPLPAERTVEGKTRVRVRLLDDIGGRVIDGKKVRAESLGRSAVFRGRTVSGDFVFEVPQAVAASSFVIEADGTADTIRFHAKASGLPLLVIDSVSGKGVDTPVIALPPGTAISGDDKGRAVLPPVIFSGFLTVKARGYRPLRISADLLSRPDADPVVRLEPVLGGLLLGKRISLDPSGGGNEEYGMGPDRLRGSTINMELARRVGSILSAAGARVGFTRHGEETVSVYERIDRVNRFAPEIALGLRFGSPSVTDEGLFAFRHYPGSRNGARAAEELSQTVCTLPPCSSPAVEESAVLFLQQTSCPACEIHAPLVEFTEALFRNPSWLDLEASLIVRGLIGFFSDGQAPCGSRDLRIILDGLPVAGSLVSLDGVFSALTDDEGIARFECVDPGRHLLTVSLPGDYDFVSDLEVTPGSPGISTIEIYTPSP